MMRMESARPASSAAWRSWGSVVVRPAPPMGIQPSAQSALLWVHAVVHHLVDVPSEADPKNESAVGEHVDRRDLLGQHYRIVLGDQADARAQNQALGPVRGASEGHQRVERAFVLFRQSPARWIRGLPASGDVGVFGEKQ